MQSNQLGVTYQGIDNVRISKKQNEACPYQCVNKNLQGNSSFKCDAPFKQKCHGYCSFPVNKTYIQNHTPSGIHWSNKAFKALNQQQTIIKNTFSLENDNWFQINSSSAEDATLIAQTDILVSDDIEIYFTNMQFNQFKNYIQSNQLLYFDSIFGGFGHDGNNQYDGFLLRNNPDIQYINQIKYKSISAYFTSIQEYTKKYLKFNQWSNDIKCY